MAMLGSVDDNSANPTRSEEPCPAPTPVLAYLELRRRVRVVAGTLMLLGFVAAAGWQPPDPVASPVKDIEPAKAEQPSVTSRDETLQTFQRFAVNALVLPLIDDTVPPRWSKHALNWICDGRGKVNIDGAPLREGEPVPASFSVRWDLERCAPFDGADLFIFGEVELVVSYDGAELRAQIIAPNLWLETPSGRHCLPDVAACADRRSARAV